MLKNYSSNNSKSTTQSSTLISNSHINQPKYHKIFCNKATAINQRVQMIKNKYSAHKRQRPDYLKNQSSIDIIDDSKENLYNMANLIDSKIQQRKHEKQLAKKVNKKNKKIQQLVQINQKINKLIDHLKTQQQQQQNIVPKLQLSNISQSLISIYKNTEPINSVSKTQTRSSLLLRADQKLNYSSINLKQSRTKYDSIRQKSNKSSKRLIGRISQKSCSLPKNYKESSFYSSKTQKQYQLQTKVQTKQLINLLCKQVQHDQKYIKSKTKLIKCITNYQSKLQNAFKFIKLTQEEKNQLLDSNLQQKDPQFTERQDPGLQKQSPKLLILQTIQNYRKSQDHWVSKISKKFNRKSINLSDLDIQNKGYFLKQDLTRFLSLYSKNMYCNRQINMLFKRINKKKGKIVSTKDLIQIICF